MIVAVGRHTPTMTPAAERWALVTGASQGIGAAIARALTERGLRVLVSSRRLEACQSLAAELPGAEALQLDVANPASIAAALEALGERPVEVLVNNAGIAESAPLVPRKGSTEDLVARQMEVNFHGARRLMEGLVPGMKARGLGRCINVASSAGLRGYAYVSAYCASKFALVGYGLAAAEELRGSGVTVQAVCPHYVDTDMVARAVDNLVAKTGRTAEEARAELAAQNPGGRLVTSEEVAAAVVGLVDEEESGLVVELDGSDAARVLRPGRSA